MKYAEFQGRNEFAKDELLAMSRGRLIEDGRPDELAGSADSRYRALLDAEDEVRRGLWDGAEWRRLHLADGVLAGWHPVDLGAVVMRTALAATGMEDGDVDLVAGRVADGEVHAGHAGDLRAGRQHDVEEHRRVVAQVDRDRLAGDVGRDRRDGLGNLVNVSAATNPGRPSGRKNTDLHDKMPGYGIVRFGKPAAAVRPA